MRLTSTGIRAFRRFIFTWWETNRRDLPWRKTRNPYKILVSEVMLQQTQVSRVLPAYSAFLQKFPDLSALSRARERDVIIAWKGLGYNRRALYLQRCVRLIIKEHHGVVPDSEPKLIQLPGLGRYTARAILVFAYEQDTSLVDTNIRKIITHYFFRGLPQPERIIEDAADALVPAGKSWEWHQALMDYGALALPGIVAKQKTHRSTKVPFSKTDRFLRGRIVDSLRISDRKLDSFIGTVASTYGRSPESVSVVVQSLIDEGLVVISSGLLRLPG